MSFSLGFNAQTVAPNLGPELVPTGIYPVKIIKSEEVPVNGKPGCSFYAFTMQVIDGDQKGKTVIERLNCKNDNQTAVDIAYGTLSAICHVAGILQISQSSQELHDRPFKISVVKVPRNDDPTRERNEIRGYMDMNGNGPGAAQPPAASPQQAAAFAQTAVSPTAVPNGQVAPNAAQLTVPAVPQAPSAPPVAAAPPAFPPEGWLPHPQAAGYYYKGQEVLTEPQLRAKIAQPLQVPTAPATTPAPAIPSWAS